MYDCSTEIIINNIHYPSIKKGATAWSLSYDVLCRAIRQRKNVYTPSDGRKVTIDYSDGFPDIIIE